MNDEAQLARLYNRSGALVNRLQRLRRSRWAPWDAVRCYNYLRADVQQWTSDPDFVRSVPSALFYPSWTVNWGHIALGLLALLVVAVVVYLLIGSTGVIVLGVAVAAVAVWVRWTRNNQLPPSLKEVRDRALALHDYLLVQLQAYPELARQVEPGRLQAQSESQVRLLSDCLQRAAALEQESEHWHELWLGLSDPLPFDLSEDVLSRLEPLEQTRLREAVQAYRVRAWTPAAAVCGMLLEGRLQRLCRDNGVAVGGMNAMIEQLGAAGLLGGHHQNLARVGEFFRHRAAHPTSEEFDQEKTTLILTLFLYQSSIEKPCLSGAAQ